MIARAYNAASDSDLIKGRDINPERDIIVVVEIAGKSAGLVALRPCLFVHDFELSDGMLKRQVTEMAMAYAAGAARAMGHREAIAVIPEDKPRMRTWFEEHGAALQDPGAVYMVEIQ